MPIFPAAPFRSIERTTNLYLYVIPGIRTDANGVSRHVIQRVIELKARRRFLNVFFVVLLVTRVGLWRSLRVVYYECYNYYEDKRYSSSSKNTSLSGIATSPILQVRACAEDRDVCLYFRLHRFDRSNEPRTEFVCDTWNQDGYANGASRHVIQRVI